ncbi:MAG: enoyl-CoA hydratase/isomerase family protein [Acidimicrobiales bacterium]
MTEHRIDVEDGEGVRVIAFDRPEVRNAFDLLMYEAVSSALDQASSDASIHAVVLTGRGKGFTSGQDLHEMAAIATGAARPEAGKGFPHLLDSLQLFEKPLLAAVHGAGVGLGFTILGHVDLVLVDETARLRCPFAEMGVPPEAASSLLLPVRMGWQSAAAALLASEWVDAHQAVETGIAWRVVPAGTVLEETLALARRIAAFPPHGVMEIKRLMMDGLRPAISAARRREESAFAALFADPATNPGSGLTSGLKG